MAATRAWVEAVIVKMKVCPFSSTADRAGLPAGGVSYPLTHAATGEEVYERFWEQVLPQRQRGVETGRDRSVISRKLTEECPKHFVESKIAF